MGWLEGLLGGYQQRHYDIEAEKRKEAEASALREGKALEGLLNARDPKIKRLAAAGILDLAKPRKKASGLAGWLGEMEASPHMQTIQRYYDAIPEVTPEADTTPTGGAITTPPPVDQSAALPAESPVVAGAPPMTPPAPAPGAGGAATPPPRPPLYRSPFLGGPAPRDTRAPNFAASAPGAAGRPPAPPPVAATPPPVAAPGASSLMSGAAVAATPAGSPLPGGSSTPTGPPPPPPAQLAQGGAPPQPGAQAQPQAGVPLQSPPPQPPGKTDLSGGPGARPRRTTLRPQAGKPDLFPTAADISAQRDEAEFGAKITNYRGMYEQMGYSPEEAHAKAVALVEQEVQSKIRSGQGALREGNPRQLPSGEWVQDLYEPTSGKVVNTIPHNGPNLTGTMQERGMIAQEMFGAQFPGLDGGAILKEISKNPKLSQVMLDEMARRKAYTAQQAAILKAEAEANFPLSRSLRQSLTNFMINDWEKHQKPMRTMREQLGKMEAGLQAIQNGDATGGAQAILVTFQKILDPTSVVRESEYDRSIGALPIKQQIQGWWQKYVGTSAADPNAVPNWVTSGVSIPIEELAKMAETAKSFITGMEAQEQVEKERIGVRADDAGVPRDYIFAKTPAVGGGGGGAGAGGGGGTGVQPPPAPPDAADPSQMMSRVPIPGVTPQTPASVTPAATAKPATGGATDDWNTPLRYDPATRSWVQQ